MAPQDIHTLKLMEAVQEKQARSQRELAEKLNMSLGLVNKLIKDQVSQGFLKTDKLMRNKIKYMITSKGVEEIIVLKKKQVSYYIGRYKKIKMMVEKALSQVKNNSENHILLYGAGELCEIACMLSEQDNCNNITIIDDKNAGKSINGFMVHHEDEMENMVYDAILIMEIEDTKQARSKLISKGVPADKIYMLFHIDKTDMLNN